MMLVLFLKINKILGLQEVIHSYLTTEFKGGSMATCGTDSSPQGEAGLHLHRSHPKQCMILTSWAAGWGQDRCHGARET